MTGASDAAGAAAGHGSNDSADPVLDAAALGAWLDEQGLGPRGEPVTQRYLSGGSQNFIFDVGRGDFRAVVRIPPPFAPAPRDEGILREYRIIEALEGTDVPHTPAVGVCPDASVLGRPFYLMGFVDGWSPMDGGPDGTSGWAEPFRSDASLRPGLADELVSGIARLSRVDWQARGLDGLGRPDGFHDRQVPRWTAFLERIRGRDLPGFDEASAWLAANRPLDFVPGIMHGDYQFANVMFADGAPARLAAIVDWEMGTVGDPKLDLAWVLQDWPDDPNAARALSYVDLSGMPGRDALAARYAEVSGRQVDDLDYYCVLARWKLAIVLEQGFQRAGDDPKLTAFGDIVLTLMAGAAEMAETTGYRNPPE